MKNIDHLPESETIHFIQCVQCDQWYDLRDLAEVMEHEHAGLPKGIYDSSIKVGEPTEYPNPEKGIDKIDLN